MIICVGASIEISSTLDFPQFFRCLETEQLFVDPMFPPCESSLYTTKSSSGITWIRASELASDPQFFVGGASRFDINQGELGDCWLLAAIANLTLHEKLFNKVVPHDQSFENEYAGIFHFRIWQACIYIYFGL